jgi:hypothetical protein
MTERAGWLGRIAAIFALAQANIFLTLVSALVLGGAAVFLTTAWLFGPKVQLEHAEYFQFRAAADGLIVDSWVALELDLARIPDDRVARRARNSLPEQRSHRHTHHDRAEDGEGRSVRESEWHTRLAPR